MSRGVRLGVVGFSLVAVAGCSSGGATGAGAAPGPSASASAAPSAGALPSGDTAPSAVVPPPSASVRAVPTSALEVPAPTRVDDKSARDMRYFYWEPPAALPTAGATGRARAEAILGSPRVRALLGASEADGFTFERETPERHMYTFRQTRKFGGQPVIVDGAHATVELHGDAELAYLGTGFRAGIELSDAPLAADEARCRTLAEAAYAAQEQAAGQATPHRDMGLRVFRRREGGWFVGWAFHVERTDGPGHSRPFLFEVDAQRGDVVRVTQSWVE